MSNNGCSVEADGIVPVSRLMETSRYSNSGMDVIISCGKVPVRWLFHKRRYSIFLRLVKDTGIVPVRWLVLNWKNSKLESLCPYNSGMDPCRELANADNLVKVVSNASSSGSVPFNPLLSGKVSKTTERQSVV